MSGSHNFTRVRETRSNSCGVCREEWVCSSGVVAKYQICSACGTIVHSSCRGIAMNCLPCVKCANPDEEVIVKRAPTHGGSVFVKLLHAYDMVSVGPATPLYGVFRVDPAKPAVRSALCISGDNHDCIWDGGKGVDNMVSASCIEVTCDDIESCSMLSIEIWRRGVLQIFDTIVAATDISLLPLFSYPGVTCERWFSLMSASGKQQGQALLQLCFFASSVAAVDAHAEDSAATMVMEDQAATSGAIDKVQDLLGIYAHTEGLGDSESIYSESDLLPNVIKNLDEVANEEDGQPYSSLDDASEDLLTGSEGGSRVSADAARRVEMATGSPPHHGMDTNTIIRSQQSIYEIYETDSDPMVSLLATLPTRDMALMHDALVPSIVSHTASGPSTASTPAVAGSAVDAYRHSDRSDEDGTSHGVKKSKRGNKDGSRNDQFDARTFYRWAQKVGKKTRQSLLSMLYETDSENGESDTDIISPGDAPSSVSGSYVASAPKRGEGLWSDYQPAGWGYNLFPSRQEPGTNKVNSNVAATSSGARASKEFSISNSGHDSAGVGSGVGVGVGKLFVHLVSACKLDVVDAADGDYYALADIIDDGGSSSSSTAAAANSMASTFSSLTLPRGGAALFKEAKTRTVHSSSNPVFNKKWVFVTPTYRSYLKLTLIDALTDQIVGVSKISTYSVLVRDSELYAGDWRKAGSYPQKIPIRDVSDPSKVVGTFAVVALFEEDTRALFLVPQPRPTLPTPPEVLSVERLTQHIARFTAIIDLILHCYREYNSIMNWDDALLTFFLLVAFVYVTLYIDSEYALSCPVFILLVIETRLYFRRVSGIFRAQVVGRDKDTSGEKFQPISILRIAVTDYQAVSSQPGERLGGISGESGVSTSGRPHLATLALQALGGGLFSSSNQSSSNAANSLASGASGGGLSSNVFGSNAKLPYIRIAYHPADLGATSSSYVTAGSDGDATLDERVDDASDDNSILFPESDKSTAKELLIGCIDASSAGTGASLSQMMSQLSKSFIGVGEVIATRESLIENFIDPWPRSPTRSEGPESSNSSASAVASSTPYDISFVYPILQPLAPITSSASVTPSASSVNFVASIDTDPVIHHRGPLEPVSSSPSPSSSSRSRSREKDQERQRSRSLDSFPPLAATDSETVTTSVPSSPVDQRTGNSGSDPPTVNIPCIQLAPLRMHAGTAASASVSNATPASSIATLATASKAAAAGNAPKTGSKVSGSSPTSQWLPWRLNRGFVRVSMYSENPSASLIESLLPTSASYVGAVDIPLRDLVPESFRSKDERGLMPEISGWFPVLKRKAPTKKEVSLTSFDEIGFEATTFGATVAFEDNAHQNFTPWQQQPIRHGRPQSDDAYHPSVYHPDLNPHSGGSGGWISDSGGGHAGATPYAWVHLRLQLDMRRGVAALGPSAAPSEDEIDASIALQRLLYGNEIKGSTTISTLWNVRDNIKYVQNLMAWILDFIESFKNIFLWVSIPKTYPFYCVLVAFWLLSALVPGRYIVLAIGLYQFLYKFLPQPEGFPATVRFNNLLASIPNDDDLDQVYFWDRKSNKERISIDTNARLKKAKFDLIFRSKFDGNVRLKTPTEGWTDAFLLLQGHRLVWWLKESDIEAGKAAHGHLLLFEHAGTTHASPLDIREVGGDDRRLVSVFGRTAQGGPMKCTVLCKDAEARKNLSEAVNSAILAKNVL